MAHSSDRDIQAQGWPTLFFVAMCLLTSSIAAQAIEISGSVAGPDGQGIPNARVYALLTSSPNPGRHNEVITDSDGRFVLKDVSTGPQEIHAYAPEQGYPDSMFAVFQTAPVPVVTVKDQESLYGVLVKLGPKPGTLSGVVVDKVDRKPLPGATVRLSWQDRPDFYVQSNIERDGTFKFWIPERQLVVVVTSAGYSPWKLNPITVLSGKSRSIIVEMVK